ncbi:MAG: oligosaccharide flippase family protein, partial [Turicibacter sp.]
MKSGWMKGTIILTITAFLVKFLSLLYKVPYQNIAGDEGLYVFQQVYPLIGVYTTLNGVVLPTIISELLLTYQFSEDIKRYIKKSLWLFGVASFALLFIGSDFIAYLMGDMHLSNMIRIVGLSFLMIPTISYLRGVSQTKAETIPYAAISSSIEQMIRVGAIIAVLFIFGAKSVYQLAYFAFVGGLFGPAAAIIYLYFSPLKDETISHLRLTHRPHFFKKMVYLFLSAGILIIFQLLDSFFVFNSLIESGIPALEAMALKGSYDRGLPIIQTATVFTGAVVSSTIPQMAGLKDLKNRKKVFNFSLFLIIAMSVPATIGLFTVVDELNIALFKDLSGIKALKLLTIQVLFYPFIFFSTAVMQQEGEYSKLLLSVLGGVFAKILLTTPLTQQLGIEGTALSSVIGLMVIALIS